MGEFKVVTANDLDSLHKQVNERMQNGWKLAQSFIVVENKDRMARTFYQPMVKNQENDTCHVM